jgi:hypothetical protein
MATRRRLVRLGLLLLLAGAATSAPALTIGVAPAEGPAYAPPPDGSGAPVGYLVSGCMDAIFDSGHIATDAPAVLVGREAWGKDDYGLTEAREGLVDYVVALYVEWTLSTFHKDVHLPLSVDYRLVRVADGEVMGEGRVDGIVDSEDSSSNEQRSASRAGALAAAPCLKTINALAMGGKR